MSRHCEWRCDQCNRVIDGPIQDITARIYHTKMLIYEGGDFCSEECLNKWCEGLSLRLKHKQEKQEVAKRLKRAKKEWNYTP